MSKSIFDSYGDEALRALREELMESIGIFLYNCGGACPVKIMLREMQQYDFSEQIRSAKRTLVRRGYIKPGTHARPENLSWETAGEVAKGIRSPYSMWELTRAGTKWVKAVLYN